LAAQSGWALDLPALLAITLVGLQIWPMFIRRGTPWCSDDVHRGAVRQERHVLAGRILPIIALCRAAGSLSPSEILPLLRHVHPDQLVDARSQLVVVIPENTGCR